MSIIINACFFFVDRWGTDVGGAGLLIGDAVQDGPADSEGPRSDRQRDVQVTEQALCSD